MHLLFAKYMFLMRLPMQKVNLLYAQGIYLQIGQLNNYMQPLHHLSFEYE